MAESIPDPPRKVCKSAGAFFDHQLLILDVLERLGNKNNTIIKKLLKAPELKNIEWDIDEILEIITEDEHEWYLLKWKDWPACFASWVKSDRYPLDQEMIDDYKAKQAKLLETEGVAVSQKTTAKGRLKNEELIDISMSLAKHVSWPTFLNMMKSIDQKDGLGVGLDQDTQIDKRCKLFHLSKPNSQIENFLSPELLKRKRFQWKLQQLEGIWLEIVNDIDDDAIPDLPEKYEYLVTNRYCSDVPPEALVRAVGCSCRSCGPTTRKCCSGQAGVSFAYRDDVPNTLLDHLRYKAIYECSSLCKCTPETCYNRVLQKGITRPLQLFKTDGRGWGLKTIQPIKRGEFVIEYVGEVITSAQADDRKDNEYLFDLDYNPDCESQYTIDAKTYGNLARFINSRCSDANLMSLAVFVECLDPQLPRMGFFAVRDIEPYEELTFDYMLQGGLQGVESCLCGSSECRGTINVQNNVNAAKSSGGDAPTSPKPTSPTKPLEKENYINNGVVDITIE